MLEELGVPVGLQVALRDITKLVETDEKLRESLVSSKVLNEKLDVVGKLTRHG